MQNEKLHKLALKLLDTGKRNNLINFKDTKSSTAQILLPDFFTVFEKAERGAKCEVFDPENERERLVSFYEDGESNKKRMSADEFLYEYRLKTKRNQMLVYSASLSPLSALKKIDKRAASAMEETGVNILYVALGFIEWFESDNSNYKMRAPLLLTPVKIENPSAADPFFLNFAEDEMIVNPTLAYKFRADYGVEIPEYDEDKGAMNYVNEIRALVKKLGFEVLLECKVGIFSFQKINMYKDLEDNAEHILHNENVLSLLGEQTQEYAVADGAEKKKEEAPLCNVVDADSSQAEAVEMARSGKSFVLQGPPGTGKSQTITNIIAQKLADGKKVLFVSEKLAALDVVYNKLKAAGLDEFCLELHSHKTNKRDVIAELCRTLTLPQRAVSQDAARETAALNAAESELSDYARELHAVREPIGKSFYELIDLAASVRDAADVDFLIDSVESKGEDYVSQAVKLLSAVAGFVPSVGGDYKKNEWYGYAEGAVSYRELAALKEELAAVVSLCRALSSEADEIAERYGTDSADGIEKARAFTALFDLLDDCKFVTPRMMRADKAQKAIDAAKAMHRLSTEILEKKSALDKLYNDGIYSLDGKGIFAKLTGKYKSAFARFFGMEYKRIVKELRLLKKDGKKPGYRDAVFCMGTLAEFIDKSAEFDRIYAEAADLFDADFSGVYTDFGRLQQELAALDSIIRAGVEFGEIAAFDDERLEKEMPEFNKIFKRYTQAFAEFGEAEGRLYKRFDSSEYDIRTVSLDALRIKLEKCLEKTDALDNWSAFWRQIENAKTLGIRKFIDKAIAKGVSANEFSRAFEKTFYAQWADTVLHSSRVLCDLERIRHDDAVKLFREKDKLAFEINKAKIRAKLSAMRPDSDMVAKGSALSVLLREGSKKRKQKGIRTLLGEIGGLALTLKPCFLMSPLSVSTYLGPETEFDTVVFDEASQIFPQDAVGAIYRGKQLIVVGDCKQMPPTNFFNSVTEDEEEDENADDVNDFESVLDLCSAVMPQKRLRWHYRSRYESLIAFSNKNFYDGSLITFPSAKFDGDGVGVDYVHVDGVFDRKSKTNLEEAEKVADIVFEYFEKYPNRSLGVVAFGISQQNLIEKVINKRRQIDKSKEEFFRSDREEPFFVKNLETVQGDERDGIILDVAYGKDGAGKLLLNFGPINREGGERRLNVAVTRAKENLTIVSALHATDIDLSRAGSRGARLMREYLDYAEFGEIALERSLTVNAYERYDSDFEEEVCEFLRDKGYSVDCQVGCSSFRIDIALKRADTSDYVLAIECDGASYHSSRSARDRDRLRQEVLERMGWKFYRIWSTDWFRNKRVEKERLLAAAHAALSSADSENAVAEQTETPNAFEVEAEEVHFEFPIYREADIDGIRKSVRGIQPLVYGILQTEAPLCEEWLLKRIAYMYGREKVTSVVTRSFERDMYACERAGIIRKRGFLYLKGAEIPMLRVPAESATPREIKYISAEELSKGIREIIAQNVSVDKNGLYKLLASRLGFTRLGDAMIARMDEALALLGEEVKSDGELLSLKR